MLPTVGGQQFLTLSQTTNFRLLPNWKSLQTTISNLMKMTRVFLNYCRKGKKRKALKTLPAFSPSHNVSRGFFLKVVRSQNCVLTHYQATNFRLFETERVRRPQLQIWRIWQKVTQMDRKHCGKRRNCFLRAISPFPTVFQKACFPGASKGVIVWEWVKGGLISW